MLVEAADSKEGSFLLRSERIPESRLLSGKFPNKELTLVSLQPALLPHPNQLCLLSVHSHIQMCISESPEELHLLFGAFYWTETPPRWVLAAHSLVFLS